MDLHINLNKFYPKQNVVIAFRKLLMTKLRNSNSSHLEV